MKKTILSVTAIATVCISGCISAYAATQASGNEDNPTILTLNEYFDSYLYTGHPSDYYTFTLNTDKKILIECDNVSQSKEYTMTLSGNGIDPIYTTDSTDGYSMYISADLSAGTYNISVEADYESRSSLEDISYHIAVFDELKNSGHIINDTDFVMIDDDFENSDTSFWLDGFRPHYVYGNKTIKSDSNGNYISFTPVNSNQYYIFEAKDVYSTNVLCSEFDIQFSTDNMELQVRQADSNLDTDFKMAGRIRKFSSNLQYYSDGEWKYMFNTTGGWVNVSANKWYTIRMTLDVRANKYSIYLEDRSTGNIISEVENVEFGEECTYISYYAFSSLSELNIDNVHIFESDTDVDIEGWTYIKIPQNGTRQYKYFNTQSISEKAWSADKWSISGMVYGISIDEDTGILSVSENARPGSIIVTASRKYYPWIKTTYLVDIDR